MLFISVIVLRSIIFCQTLFISFTSLYNLFFNHIYLIFEFLLLLRSLEAMSITDVICFPRKIFLECSVFICYCLVCFLFSNGQVMSCVLLLIHHLLMASTIFLAKIIEMRKQRKMEQFSASISVYHINIFIFFKENRFFIFAV